MKKITYKIDRGLVIFMVNNAWIASFRSSNDLERNAHIRAFITGLRWGRHDEFDPVAVEIK